MPVEQLMPGASYMPVLLRAMVRHWGAAPNPGVFAEKKKQRRGCSGHRPGILSIRGGCAFRSEAGGDRADPHADHRGPRFSGKVMPKARSAFPQPIPAICGRSGSARLLRWTRSGQGRVRARRHPAYQVLRHRHWRGDGKHGRDAGISGRQQTAAIADRGQRAGPARADGGNRSGGDEIGACLSHKITQGQAISRPLRWITLVVFISRRPPARIKRANICRYRSKDGRPAHAYRA